MLAGPLFSDAYAVRPHGSAVNRRRRAPQMHHRFRVEPLRSCEPAARPRALVTSLRRSGTSSRVRPTVAIVDNIVATTFSLVPVIATTSPEHTLTVRPGLTTLPRATIRSP